MNFRRLSSRATVAAASTALAAGSVLAIAPAANAVEVSNTYTCAAAGLYSGNFPLTVNGGFPEQYYAGATVPADTLKALATATVPEDARGLLQLAQIESARADDFAFDLGGNSVPMPAAGDFSDDYSTWNGAAGNAKFVTPAPGTYTVTMPEAFTLTTVNAGGDSAVLDCTLAEGQEAASLGQTTLLKQSATVTAPKSVKAKKGTVAKVKVSVAGEAGPVAGKVVALKGKKTLGSAKLKAGKAVISLGKLPVGKHKVTIKYAGNKSVNGDTAKTVVKVVR